MLKILIKSFSLKKGYPELDKKHGGGFVFDCRCLPNPGREVKYQLLTGLDEEVEEFLNGDKEVLKFLNNIKSIINQAVENYISRNFDLLSISFGCTGGQHRSVYIATKINEYLKVTYPQTETEIRHMEIDN